MTGIMYGRDEEVVQRLKPEPMTSEEAGAQDDISDLEFKIFNIK